MSSPGIALLLLLIALVLGASTLATRHGNSQRFSLMQGLGSLLWASPVIAVLAFVAMRVVPHFQFGTSHQTPAEASPSWLQTEEGSVKVEDVDGFEEETTPVSTDGEAASEDPLPAWTSHEVLRLKSSKGDPKGEVWRVVKVSLWEKSVEAARENLLKQTSNLVQADFNRFFSGGSALTKEGIQNRVIRAEAIQTQVHEDVDTPFTMYKVYWQVELSPEVRAELSDAWKQEIARKRAWLLGEVMALLTLIAFSFAAYFQMDKRSQGTHRFRLKLAATALMTAGGLGLLAALPPV
jgi:hypothetical protein